MSKVSIALLFAFTAVLVSAQAQSSENVNTNPVIGILAIPSDYEWFPANNWNYMAASYVKYIESAGARVVPIQWDLPLKNLTALIRGLNGVLFTGGSANSLNTDKTLNPFGQAVQNIVNLVIQINNEGTHYPLWGTCMGYQLISCTIAGQSSGNYDCLYSQPGFYDFRTNLTFIEGSESHPMFANISQGLKDAFKAQGITYFHFRYTVQRNLWKRMKASRATSLV